MATGTYWFATVKSIEVLLRIRLLRLLPAYMFVHERTDSGVTTPAHLLWMRVQCLFPALFTPTLPLTILSLPTLYNSPSALLADKLLQSLLVGRVGTMRYACHGHPHGVRHTVLLVCTDTWGKPSCIISVLLPGGPHLRVLCVHPLHSTHSDFELEHYAVLVRAKPRVALGLGNVSAAVHPRAEGTPRRAPEPPGDDGVGVAAMGAVVHGVATAATRFLPRLQHPLLLRDDLPSHVLQWHR